MFQCCRQAHAAEDLKLWDDFVLPIAVHFLQACDCYCPQIARNNHQAVRSLQVLHIWAPSIMFSVSLVSTFWLFWTFILSIFLDVILHMQNTLASMYTSIDFIILNDFRLGTTWLLVYCFASILIMLPCLWPKKITTCRI